ncbi:MAG: oxidoreductase-like domain-containing protein [Luteimonas sp.]
MQKQSAGLNLSLVRDDDPRPEPPEAPLPSDCCDSGCDPCVHDSYSDELQYYRQQLAKWLERHPEAKA